MTIHKRLRLVSWNVNGIRAVHKKGALRWWLDEKPEILCLQETKADESQIPLELRNIPGYHAYYASGLRKGYSGVALYTRLKPARMRFGFGSDEFDREGRVIAAEYDAFTLFNIYFPNGKASKERLAYKLAFYDSFLEHLLTCLKKQDKIIICGDVNTAHKEIDLARPKENEKVSGFLPVERAWLDKLMGTGFIDTFRMFTDEPGHYSWWDMKTRARERNVGWRIDYVFVSESLRQSVTSAFILPDVMGSDHCPVGIELSL